MTSVPFCKQRWQKKNRCFSKIGWLTKNIRADRINQGIVLYLIVKRPTLSVKWAVFPKFLMWKCVHHIFRPSDCRGTSRFAGIAPEWPTQQTRFPLNMLLARMSICHNMSICVIVSQLLPYIIVSTNLKLRNLLTILPIGWCMISYYVKSIKAPHDSLWQFAE